MCEFCNNPLSNKQNDKDARHVEFAGFFSSDAIDAAIRQTAAAATKSRQDASASDDDDAASDEDSDGT